MRKLIVLLILAALLFTACTQQNKMTEEQAVEKPDKALQTTDEAPSEDVEAAPARETELNARPAIESVPEVKKTEKDFKPLPPRRYLLINGIKLDVKSIAKETPEMNTRVDYPEISGLLDKNLQNKLNSEFADAAKKFAEKPMTMEAGIIKQPGTTGQKVERWYSFSTNANFNNILSIGFYSNEHYGPDINISKFSPVLLELKGGEKLSLNDLFVDGVDAMEVLNGKIVKYILKENLEEWALSAPFQGLKPDQPFYITENMLVIVFDERNTEFTVPSYQIGIPIEEFGGVITVFDKFADSKQKLYDKEKLAKKILPAPIKVKWELKREEKPEYNIWIQIAKFENVNNKELQNKLNSIPFNTDLEDFKKIALKAYAASKEKAPSSRVVNMAVHGNLGDFLSISSYDGTSIGGKEPAANRKFHNYNTKTGQELALKDLFNEGFNYIEMVKNNIRNQLGERKPTDAELKKLDSVIDRAGFFFDEFGIQIHFKSGEISKNIKEEIQIFNPFETIEQENLSIYN